MDKTTHVVLSCVDGSIVSDAVCDYSSWVASTLNTPLKLLHAIERHQDPAIVDFSGAIGLGTQEELLNELTAAEQSRSRLLRQRSQLMLDNAKQRVVKAGVKSLETIQLHGSLTDALIELIDDSDMVVIGIRGHGHHQSDEGIGSQVEEVIRLLHKPILVVNKTYVKPKKIMLAYDGSDAAKKALAMVKSSLLFHQLECHIVYVGEDGQALLDEALSLLEDTTVRVTVARLTGKVDEVLSEYQRQQQIDLTLMGAFSHNRVRDFLLGSVTEKMLSVMEQPLLLLR